MDFKESVICCEDFGIWRESLIWLETVQSVGCCCYWSDIISDWFALRDKAIHDQSVHSVFLRVVFKEWNFVSLSSDELIARLFSVIDNDDNDDDVVYSFSSWMYPRWSIAETALPDKHLKWRAGWQFAL